MILCGETIITPAELIIDPVRTPLASPTLDFVIPDEGVSLEAVEQNLIRKALDKTDGNQSRAAALLRITRNTLRYRMEKYGMLGGA
jgi:two-component system NtrC family response regulator